MLNFLAFLSFLAWIYLALARNGFHRCDARLRNGSEQPLTAPVVVPPVVPTVIALIPARDEAATIAEVIRAHGRVRYGGDYRVLLVDDQSKDGTASAALAASAEGLRLDVMEGAPLPAGWSGKMWAVHQGLTALQSDPPDYVLLTDADIAPHPTLVGELVAKAEAERLDLTSLLARLDDRGLWAGLLIPAFVFFFQKLYPFPSVNDRDRSVAAAAGGVMLARWTAIDAIGGVASIKGALIDDCALAAAMKSRSPGAAIWLGLATREARSLRDNRAFSSIWRMVSRSAYAQLEFSPLMLAVALAGMALLYLAPVFAAIVGVLRGDLFMAGCGAGAWVLMCWLYAPTLALYGRRRWEAALLPVAGALYGAMTFSSALDHWRGRGAQWKGRRYSARNKPSPSAH